MGMGRGITVSGAKIQQAVDIRDQILIKDSNFVGMVGQLLNNPEFANIGSEKREQILRNLHSEHEIERNALIDFGRSIGVI